MPIVDRRPNLISSASRTRRTAKARGLTLIELTVVVAILAVLAMLLMPRLAFIRTMSLHASSATTLQEVSQNLLTFHATQAKWPHRFDSLLTGNGGTAAGLYGSGGGNYGLDTTLSKAVSTTDGALLVKTTLDSNQVKSLVGLLGNINTTTGKTVCYVMDHNEAITKPGNSASDLNNSRDLNSGGDTSVCTINPNHNVNPSDPNAASGALIYATVYPEGTPTNETLVALGVGPSCTAVSKTIITPPQLYMKDATRYNRAIVLIRVRNDGVQASLASAISPDGRTLDQCLGNYRVTAER
jgi:prepilin-type N-terminal cleavage/methylation domain-containing protein